MKVIANDREIFYGLDADTKTALATSGIGAAASIGAALASRQRQMTDVEQTCGKKPLLFGKQKWQACANKFAKSSAVKKPASNSIPVAKAQSSTTTTAKKDKTLMWVGIAGGALVLIGIGIYLYKRKK